MADPIPALFIARHGQTPSNLMRRYAGRSSERLTLSGVDEIRVLASRVAGVGLTEIRTSEIARARESAEILAEALRVSIVPDARLNEMSLGPWEGLTEDEVAERYPREYRLWLERPDLLHLDGRETLDELADRVAGAIGDVARAGKRVLLMTHVAPIRVAALRHLGLPLRLYKRVPVQNADCFAVGAGSGAFWPLGDGAAFRRELEAAAGEATP